MCLLHVILQPTKLQYFLDLTKKMAIILQIEQANGDFFAICKLETGKGN